MKTQDIRRLAWAIALLAAVVLAAQLFRQKSGIPAEMSPAGTPVPSSTVPAVLALDTQYVTSLDAWPPAVEEKDGPFACVDTGSRIAESGRTNLRRISGRDYCVTVQSEGAAGSTYTTYTYVTEKEGSLLSARFVLKTVQCANYDEPKMSQCRSEQATFDLDSRIDAIFSKN